MIRLTEKQSRAYRLEVRSTEDRPDPSEPTEHWCGSAAKIETMRVRCDRGQSVFHPLDAREIIDRNHNDIVPAIKQRFERYAEDRRQAADRCQVAGSMAIRLEIEAALGHESDKFTGDGHPY